MPLDKTRVLMMNGIYKVDGKDNNDEFIQYNDFLKHKTFFQCPKCKSLNAVSYTHLTLPTTCTRCRSRWSPYH